jgi:hypothetical protein
VFLCQVFLCQVFLCQVFLCQVFLWQGLRQSTRHMESAEAGTLAFRRRMALSHAFELVED